MNLVLQRKPTAADWMFGSLFVDGAWECYTLEDELRENKVQAETAIPAGLYEVVLEDSPKYGKDTPTLKDVKNFSYIRMHSVRDDEDTSGCIGLGDKTDETLGKISGGIARGIEIKLKAKIIAAIRERSEQVWIEVKNAPGDKFVDSGKVVTA